MREDAVYLGGTAASPMRTLTTLAAGSIMLAAQAQVVERCTQNTLATTHTNVERWNDTLWLFTGVEGALQPFGSRASFYTLDTNGTGGFGGWFGMPNMQRVEILATTAHDDRPAVIAGLAQALCDSPVYGMVGRLSTSLGAYWLRTLGNEPIAHVADPDTFIHAGSGDQLIVLGQSGDSLNMIATSMGAIRRMTTADTLSVLACDNGVSVHRADGTELVARPFTNGADDALGYEGVGFALISNGWLYRTGPDLIPFDSVEVAPLVAPLHLRYFESGLWVIGQDSARFYDPSLTELIILAMDPPPGYRSLDAGVSSTALMTCGHQAHGGMRAAALRGVSKFGAPDDHAVDVRLDHATFDETDFQPVIGPAGSYAVTGTTSAWLVNEGTVQVDMATLGGFSVLSTSCVAQNALTDAPTTLLDPGDSALVALGELTDTISWSAPNVSVCLTATAPQRLMDRDSTDNTTCAQRTYFVSVNEHATVPAPTIVPNPASDRIALRTADPRLLGQRWRITDTTGRTVLAGIWTGEAIEISSLRQGGYLLQLENTARPAIFIVAR